MIDRCLQRRNENGKMKKGKKNNTQIGCSDVPFTSQLGDCHSLVEQHRRNIIDDIIIFHLTTDFRPDADADADADSDADVPTVFFRFRFVGIFLLVRFLRAIFISDISVAVTVDGVWAKTN